MFKVFDVSYDELMTSFPSELYKLRKMVFHDRLQWQVSCLNDMEFDEYDKHGTHYLIGIFNKKIVCSVRFIELNNPNMIANTFNEFFHDIDIPADCFESSRFFVDKTQVRDNLGKDYPVSTLLFLAMINYTRRSSLKGIYTIVSHSMLLILKKTDWEIKKLKEAFISEKERIYLVFLPTRESDQIRMASKIQKKINCSMKSLLDWPVLLPTKL